MNVIIRFYSKGEGDLTPEIIHRMTIDLQKMKTKTDCGVAGIDMISAADSIAKALMDLFEYDHFQVTHHLTKGGD